MIRGDDVKNEKQFFSKFSGSILLFLLLMILAFSPSYSADKIRRFVHAGLLYPGEPQVIRETIERLYKDQKNDTKKGKLVACVVPHSGWGLCGELVARSFAEINENQFDNVVILAPSHYVVFSGCSIPSVQGFATPLGVVRVDFEKLEQLSVSPYFDMYSIQRDTRSRSPRIHEEEYSIEVILPFLQYKLKKFAIVPVLVGDFKDSSGKESQIVYSGVVNSLRKAIKEKTLLVLSTDLTPWGATFNYTPGSVDDMLSTQRKLDEELVNLIVRKDLGGLQEFFERTKAPVCGKNAIYLFVALLPKNAEGIVLGYEQSGSKMNLKGTSLGFASVNFYVADVMGE
ncbi:MAG: AmmeMemoRadiSam system protein B [Candidatus Hydrogenedentes bacterium]|nr:AmmeMemoRadiSam system protein B [Candidatus Hydrogenedentota bacterium]